MAIEGEILGVGHGKEGTLEEGRGVLGGERKEFFGRRAQSLVASFYWFSSVALETRKELAPEFGKNRIK